MSTYEDSLDEFQGKFSPDVDRTHYELLPADLQKLRDDRLMEEAEEALRASEQGDVMGYIDALVDIVYIAIGTARMMNVDFEAHFAEVHSANMRKRRAKRNGEDSKHGSAFDIVKPEGWTGPDHYAVKERSERRVG